MNNFQGLPSNGISIQARFKKADKYNYQELTNVKVLVKEKNNNNEIMWKETF